MDCVCRHENMGAGPRSRALRSAVVVFAVTLAAALVLAQLGLAPAWRLGLFVPFYMAVYMASVALVGTCGFTAFRGMRNIDGTEERIADPEVLREARRFGTRVMAVAAGAAVALTLGVAVV